MTKSLKAHLHLDHTPKLLRRSQNTVYEAIFDDNTPCIIRVTDSQHRSRTAIAEEIRALNRLSQKCNFICKPLRGPENRFIEELTIENEIKYISFFEQAKGQYPDFHLEADVARAATCLAQFHQQSAALQHAYKRRQADRSPFLKAKPDRRYPQMSQLIDWQVNLAKQAGTYGLIHGDFNATNIKLNTPQIRLFDFDDCGYHWYAYDIANAIYMFLFDHRNEALHKVSAFADTFLSAYETYRPVNHEEVNQFISYRVCLLNTWLNRPNQGPLVIRTSSQKWITDLKTFVDDYFSRLIHTIKF